MKNTKENTEWKNNPPENRPYVFISTGDLNGIGPEIILKTLANLEILDLCIPIIFSSQKIITYFKKNLNLENFNFFPIRSLQQLNPKKINVFISYEEEVHLQPGVRNRNLRVFAIQSLRKALEAVRSTDNGILVTGPIDKELMFGEDFPFTGHTHCLEKVYQTSPLMMMVSTDISLRIATVSEHIPLGKVPEMITAEKVEHKIRTFYHSLRQDFLIVRPKIAVLGLNPHAGDNGTIGTEEKSILEPVMEKLKNEFTYLFGPFGADGFFGSGEYRKYDGILSMYHDQGLIPFKMLSFYHGVNFTAGLPIVRTSPDHGPAFSIAGKNISSYESFAHSIYLGLDILKNRKLFKEMNAKPLARQNIENS